MFSKGWIGEPEQVLQALGNIGADRDADGSFLIYSQDVISGLDGSIVVPGGTGYSVGGKQANLAELLTGSAFGTPVNVL